MTEPDKQAIEYSLFAKRHPVDAGVANPPFEHLKTTTNMELAFKEAESLHADGKYSHIEVRKKFVDPKNGRTVDIPLKTFEGKPKKEMSILLILLLAFICSAIAFGVTFFLTKK